MWLKTIIRLDNNGIGPLIIKSLNVYFQDEENKLVCEKWPTNLFLKKREHIRVLTRNLGQNRAIRAGDSITLLECRINPKIKEQRVELNTLRMDLVKISYYELEFTDIYETIFEIKKMSVPSRAWKQFDPENEKTFIGPFPEKNFD